MTERTCCTGGALRLLVTCTVTVALVATFFVTVPTVRADDDAVQIPSGQEKPGRLIVSRGDGEPSNQPLVSTNDTCAGADVIPAGTYPVLSGIHDIGANTDAGDPPAPSCAFAGNEAQGAAWWSFTPTETNTYFFSTCVPGTTHDDKIVGVYSSSDNTCAGTLTQIGCDDDQNAGCPQAAFLSKASAVLTAGQTYYVVVWNWAAPPASALVQVEVTKSLAPGNDTCAGATNVPLNRTTRGTLLTGTNDYSLPAGGTCYVGFGNNLTGDCLAAGRDVVYKFTAPAAGKYSVRARADATAGGNLVLYTSSACPTPGVQACPGGVSASNKNFIANAFAAREEISCQFLNEGDILYAVVDECVASTGGAHNIEVAPCFDETEPNDTTGSANTAPFAGVSPVTGRIVPGTDVDFFSLGAPAAGSRLFAHADTNSANSGLAVPANETGDLDLRVTTTTDTLEYDNSDSDLEHGNNSGAVGGTILTGSDAFIRVDHRTGIGGEPYLLYSAVQPPGFGPYGTSASLEVNEGPNNDFPGAETAGNLFWQGTLFNSTDFDFYRICASTGDVINIIADSDPTKTDVLPGKVLVTGFSAVTGGQLGAFSANNPASAQVANHTPSPGTLTGLTPFTPAESWIWRAEYDGPHFGYIDMRGTPVNGQDYLYSVTVNGQIGADMLVDIQLTETAPPTVGTGDIFVYELTLTNNGPSTATGLQFFKNLPGGVAFVDFGLTGVDDLFGSCLVPPPGDVGGTLSCTFDCVPAERTITIQIAVQVFYCTSDFQIFTETFANVATAFTAESTLFSFALTDVIDDNACEGDGDACTTEVCDQGSCVPSGTLDCNDNNACTTDSCDADTGCVYDPVDPDDGDACTTDSCDPDAGNQHDPIDCNDGNPCTDDSCDSGTGCVYGFNTNPCDDGDPGTSNDTCDGAGNCVGESACEPGAIPRSKGYYRSLCNAPHSGDELTAADAACVAAMSATFAHVTSVADVCTELGPDTPNNDACEKSEVDLMALALNLCKGKVCNDQGLEPVCGASESVGEAFDAADAILSDPDRTAATCDGADCLTRGINNGHLLNVDTLQVSVVAGETRLDWEVPLTDVPPNSYRIWRRPAGSLAPFTQIGTSTTPHYVDMTGSAGNFEYEIQAQ